MSREPFRSDVAAEAARRLAQIVEAAERAAQQVIDDAEAQARGILTEAQAEADRVVAERLAEAALSAEALISRAETIRVEAESLKAALGQALAILDAGSEAGASPAPQRGHLSAVPPDQGSSLRPVAPAADPGPAAPAAEPGPISVPFGGPETETPVDGEESAPLDSAPAPRDDATDGGFAPGSSNGVAAADDGERRRTGRPFSVNRDDSAEFGPPSPNGRAGQPPAVPPAPDPGAGGPPGSFEPPYLRGGEPFRGSPASERAGTPAGARLLATQLAVSGSSREEIATRLRNGFEIEDTDAILDAILGPED